MCGALQREHRPTHRPRTPCSKRRQHRRVSCAVLSTGSAPWTECTERRWRRENGAPRRPSRRAMPKKPRRKPRRTPSKSSATPSRAAPPRSRAGCARMTSTRTWGISTSTPLHRAPLGRLRGGPPAPRRRRGRPRARAHVPRRSSRHCLGRRLRKAGGGFLPPNEGTTTLLQVAKKEPIDHDLLQRFLDAGVDLHAGFVWVFGTKKMTSGSLIQAAARAADARALELLLAAGADDPAPTEPWGVRNHARRRGDQCAIPTRFRTRTRPRRSAWCAPRRASDGYRRAALFALKADDAGLLRELLDHAAEDAGRPRHDCILPPALRLACRRCATRRSRRLRGARGDACTATRRAGRQTMARAPERRAVPHATPRRCAPNLRGGDGRRGRRVRIASARRLGPHTRWHEDLCRRATTDETDDQAGRTSAVPFSGAVAARAVRRGVVRRVPLRVSASV